MLQAGNDLDESLNSQRKSFQVCRRIGKENQAN